MPQTPSSRPAGRKRPLDVAARRLAFLALLAERDCTVDEIREALKPSPSRRNVQKDLAWAQQAFPEHLVRTSTRGQDRSGRVAYRWQGQLPHRLAQTLDFVTDEELLALIAARGILASGTAAPDGANADPGPLASAIRRLLERAGVAPEVRDSQAITISRFAAAPIAAGVLEGCLSAIHTGQALEFTYANQHGDIGKAHAAPQRLVFAKGEWFAVMWRRRGLTTHRLSRMSDIRLTSRQPAGKPVSIPRHEIEGYLAAGFQSTWDQPLTRVTLAIRPEGWPHLANRTWGSRQIIDGPGKRLPKGWHRLSFATRGMDECRHWVLGMGGNVRVEAPKELRAWIRAQARTLCT